MAFPVAGCFAEALQRPRESFSFLMHVSWFRFHHVRPSCSAEFASLGVKKGKGNRQVLPLLIHLQKKWHHLAQQATCRQRRIGLSMVRQPDVLGGQRGMFLGPLLPFAGGSVRFLCCLKKNPLPSPLRASALIVVSVAIGRLTERVRAGDGLQFCSQHLGCLNETSMSRDSISLNSRSLGPAMKGGRHQILESTQVTLCSNACQINPPK